MFMRVVKNNYLKVNMAEVKNYQEVVDIASKHLGTVGGAGYKDTYAPELLVKIPRYLNREGYGLTSDSFVGVDTWNCYEVSAITTKGQPVAGMLKIVCPSNSEFHVESKSIKLYLNSFNMTRIGDNAADCISGIEARVKRDLDELLETTTTVSFYASDFETEPDYPFIKGGVISFSKYLSSYYSKDNVRVNVIAPGGIFNKQPEGFTKRYNAMVPMKRMASAKDIVGASIFLASDASSYVTGVVIPVDGGWTAG